MSTLDSGVRSASQGASTTNDFRYARLWFEVPIREIQTGTSAGGKSLRWYPFPKGGSRSRFFSDVSLVVNWSQDGREMKANIAEYRGSRGWGYQWTASLNGYRHYFDEGLTWLRRSISVCVSAMPSGCIFSSAAQAIHTEDDSLSVLLALCNSSTFNYLVELRAGQAGAASYEVGLIGGTPLPELGNDQSRILSALAYRGWAARRSLDTAVEVSHAFVLPAVLQVTGGNLGARVAAWAERVAGVELELARVQSEIDKLCFEFYGISEEDRRAITEGFGVRDSDDSHDSDDVQAEPEAELDPKDLAAGLVSWAVGVAAGRFDVRLAIGEPHWPKEPDPFDPLPACSPGMLTGDDRLQLVTPPDGYPIVPSPVLVDDPGHPLDLTAKVRSVFDVVFGDQADAWWSDVGAVLDPKNGVEGWLRRRFFDHHLKTYSKSRRKAPIMWPIGTKSGSYRVWLYAHQVTHDTLFRILGDVVEPKLATEQRRLSDLTQEFGPSPSASQRRTLDAQQTLVDELIELRHELQAIAPLWHPDLNDGIVIVLAPLWRLFTHHRAWSKELRDRWAKLTAGDYDWAQLAMHIWPERVIPKCANDRSLAIAHHLEDTFWTQDETNPDKWHPRHTPTTPIDQLIAERTNPTTHTARTHPTP